MRYILKSSRIHDILDVLVFSTMTVGTFVVIEKFELPVGAVMAATYITGTYVAWRATAAPRVLPALGVKGQLTKSHPSSSDYL